MTAQASHILERGSIRHLHRFPRLLVEITIGAATSHNFWTGLSNSLANGGAFVATHNDLRIGSLIELHVLLPGETMAIVALAQVLQRNPYSSDDIEPGYVMQFVDIEGEALAKIRRFVAGVRPPLFFDID